MELTKRITTALLLLLFLQSGLQGQTAQKWIARGNKEENPEKKLNCYRKATEADPLNSLAFVLYGNAKYELGQIRSAMDQYIIALRLNPNNTGAYTSLATAQYNLGMFEEAEENVSVAISMDRSNPALYRLRGYCHESMDNHEKAVRDYSRTIELDPQAALAFYRRGWSYWKLGQMEKALADHNESLRLDPGDGEVLYARGRAFYSLEKYEEAIADFSFAIRVNPLHKFSHLWLAKSFYELERFEEALVEYSAALKLDPEWPDAYNGKGNALFYLDRKEESIVEYTLAVQYAPGYSTAYQNRGNVYRDFGKFYQAIEDYELSLQADSSNAPVYRSIGDAKRKLGYLEESIWWYDQALASDTPDSLATYNNRGYANLGLDRAEEALEDLQKCLALDSVYDFGHSNRGTALLALGRYEEAIADFDKALETAEEYRWMMYANRGLARENLGDLDGAIADYRLALEDKPGYERAQKFLKEAEMLASGPEPGWRRSTTWVVSVAIGNDSTSGFPPLHGDPVKSQAAFCDFLKGQHRLTENQITALNNEQAGRAAILDAIRTQLCDPGRVKEGDLVIFYFSGYGSIHPDGSILYPIDHATGSGPLTESEIGEILANSPTSRTLCLFELNPTDTVTGPEVLSDGKPATRSAMTSIAFRYSPQKHPQPEVEGSWFSFFLIAGLRRAADADLSGMVSAAELFALLSRNLRHEVRGSFQYHTNNVNLLLLPSH